MTNQLEINFWNNMNIKHKDSYTSWCPESIKKEVNKRKNICDMCLIPKCECQKYYLCNKCKSPFACFNDVNDIICDGEVDVCNSCYGINCHSCNEFKHWENFEKDLILVNYKL